MKETPLWAAEAFSSWPRDPESCLRLFSNEALSRMGADDVSLGYLFYLEKVKDVFSSTFKVSGAQLKALREFPLSSSSGGLLSILHDPRFDIYIINYIQSLEYAIDRTCFAIDSSRIWYKYYEVISALESCSWRHQSACIALRKDLLQCICKRIVMDNASIFSSVIQDKLSSEAGQLLSSVELYNTYNKVLSMAKNIERAQGNPAYSLSEVFQAIAKGDEKGGKTVRHIENSPLAVYHSFVGLFDETVSFCTANDISDRITGRILYTFCESAIYFLGKSLPAIYLDVAIRISGHIVSSSIIQELFQRSAAETIFGYPVQIKKPFEDAIDLACNILQRGVAMHPRATLLYVSLMELLRHRSLDQHGSAVIAQLYNELIHEDLEDSKLLSHEAFAAAKYILRYTLETTGITSMISQVYYILEHKAVAEDELWDTTLHIIASHFGEAQGASVLITTYDCFSMSLMKYILRHLHRSILLLQRLWNFAHAALKKEGLLGRYLDEVSDGMDIFSLCYYLLSDADLQRSKTSVDFVLTRLLTDNEEQISSASPSQTIWRYNLIILLFLLRIQIEQQLLCNAIDDLADFDSQGALLADILLPYSWPDGSTGPHYPDLSVLSHMSPLLQCVSFVVYDSSFSVWDKAGVIERLLLVLRHRQTQLKVIGVSDIDPPTLASFFSESSLASKVTGCSQLCLLKRESIAPIISSSPHTLVDTYYCLASFIICNSVASDSFFRKAISNQEGIIGEFEALPEHAFPTGRCLTETSNFIRNGTNPTLWRAALFQQRYLSLSAPFTLPEVFAISTRSINELSLRPDSAAPGVPAKLLHGGISNLYAYDSVINKSVAGLQQDDSDASNKRDMRTVLIHGRISLPETTEKRIAAVSKAPIPFTTPMGVAAFIEKVCGENLTHRVRIDTWKVPLPDIRLVFDRVRRYEPVGPVRTAPAQLLRPTAQLPTSEQAEAVLALGPAGSE